MGYHEDMPDDQGGSTIMFAPWPKPLDDDFRGHYGLDDCYLDMVNAKYELVTQGRNLRREGNIPASKKVRFVFKPAKPTVAARCRGLEAAAQRRSAGSRRPVISRRKAPPPSTRNWATSICRWKG